MPNGGPDVCANCYFNEAVQKYGPADAAIARPARDSITAEREAYCEIRGIRLPAPYHLTCGNFRGPPLPINDPRMQEPEGPLFRRGLETGIGRVPWIPWHFDVQPAVGREIDCTFCERHSNNGILLELSNVDENNSADLGFCTNLHYVVWWCSVHGDAYVTPDDY